MITIVGAGMAGLITAHMLRRWEPVVLERQLKLPDNHGALLRFRTDAVAEATGIPFRRVTAYKAVLWRGRMWQDLCPLDAHNAYAIKVTGHAAARSVLDLKPGTRYIAPDTFLADLARGVSVRYGYDVTTLNMGGEPWVSTMPMPAAMALAQWGDGPPMFPHLPVWSMRVNLGHPVDLYQTLYYPGGEPYYRASITGNTLIVEYMGDPDVSQHGRDFDIDQVMRDFGLQGLLRVLTMSISVSRQEYGKLLPVDDHARRAFIVAATTTHNMYSVGRFAVWRQILLDDVVQDVRRVAAMIEDRTPYLRMLGRTNG